MRLTIIRHGKTQSNIERRFSGCRTDEPLTDEGRAALCSIEGVTDDSMVFTSPMIRARETAAILFPGKDPIVIDDLREMDFGRFEPHNHEELDGDPEYQAWIDSVGEMKVPGGESRAEFGSRVLSAVTGVLGQAARSGCDDVFIVAHGGTVMAFMSGITGSHYYDFLVDNGCGYTIDLEVDDAGNIARAGSYGSFCGGIRAGSRDRGPAQDASSGEMDWVTDRFSR